MKEAIRVYGLMAEFEDPASLVTATRRAYQEGYRRMDAYSPFPVEGLAEALGARRRELPLIVLLGGLVGCFGGYLYAVLHRRNLFSAKYWRPPA